MLLDYRAHGLTSLSQPLVHTWLPSDGNRIAGPHRRLMSHRPEYSSMHPVDYDVSPSVHTNLATKLRLSSRRWEYIMENLHFCAEMQWSVDLL